MSNKLLTIDDFNAIEAGSVFMHGITHNNTEELYMTNNDINRELFYVAKKGYGNDFAVYVLWNDKTISTADVCCYGDKVRDKEAIKKLINCDDEVIKRYRRQK